MARILADGIPATSFAAGANEIGGVTANFNYHAFIPQGVNWPNTDEDEKLIDADKLLWEHSDIKNVAYFYAYKFFNLLIGIE